MNRFFARYSLLVTLLLALAAGQVISYFAAPASWRSFIAILPRILSMIAFWGPVSALIAAVFVWLVLRLLGFESLQAIRQESVQQNNPTPAILFVGTLIASLLFLLLVIKP
jgi:hypothetical protein